ncbi:MAG: hypothetical protein ACLSDH_04640 [Bacilli bacterium]|jgi:DNA-directed RNA polymerase specialized sigma subunit
MDKHLEEKTLLGWIKLIENQKLYEAVKGLSTEDQIFISYIVRENKTQQELAEKYRISQQNISKRFSKVSKRLRQLLNE